MKKGLKKQRPAGVATEEEIAFMGEVDAAIYRTGRSYAYVLSLIICLLIVIFVLWAKFTVLDVVTRGMGQVIPSKRVQVIQNLEGGILQEILVADNQIVEKGAVLLRIDNTMAASQYRGVLNRALVHQAAIARLTAEVEGGKITFPKEVKKADPHIVGDQISIFNTRKQQLKLELNVLQSQYEQRIQEIAEMKSRKRQLQRSLKLAAEQRDIAKPLVKQEIYPRVDFLTLEREVSTLYGDIQNLKLAMPRVRKAADEAKRRMAQRRAEFGAVAQDEINKRRAELTPLQEALAAGADRVTRTDVRSPVRGTVKQININTVGGVIQPGEPILEIVPLDDTLLIEARIRPADIAFLHPGQPAMIKVSAYDFSIYGGLEGVVEQISADTIQDDQGESFFKVKLRTKTNSLLYRGERLPIIPGMTAGVDILTGKKSVLDYLLKPILKAKQNALRER